MKIKIFLLFVVGVAMLFNVRDGNATETLKPMREDFQSQELGKFPDGFSTYPFQRNKVIKVYRVQEEGGNRFLHAEDLPEKTMQILKRFHWDKNATPRLSWKWRAMALPKNGAEDNPSLNDSACAIYVAYGGWSGKAIKYVWSTTVPVGKMIEKDDGRLLMVVLESGPKKVGEWKTESLDIVKEYEKYFHKSPPQPNGFGILTDGDQTRSSSICDYDDFTVSE